VGGDVDLRYEVSGRRYEGGGMRYEETFPKDYLFLKACLLLFNDCFVKVILYNLGTGQPVDCID